MSKRWPGARWVLPDPVDPTERVCYIVPVPNERHHIANFLGAVAALASAYNWADDDAHTAILAARVWFDIFDGLLQRSCALIGGDDVQFRQSGCKLEFSIDCVHWSTLYDPTNCIALGTTQPPADGVLTSGECRTYVAIVQGNGRYLLPVPVQEGYRVTITDVSGGWNDGSGVGGWYCPDGTPYILGVCAGAAGHVGGDPDASDWHGQVIAQAGSLFFPASSGVFVIPAGEPSEALEFFMNDASLGDNSGSITLTIEVCAQAPSTWTHLFDFTVDNGAWADAGNGSSYVATSYWLGGPSGIGNAAGDAYIKRDAWAGGARIITEIIVTFTQINNGGTGQLNNLHCYDGVPNVFNGSQASAAGAAQSVAYNPGLLMDEIIVDYNAGQAATTETRILSVAVTGFGTDPF